MAKKLMADSFVPKIALGVAAHPDDLDFSAAGSVAAWTAAGAAVYYLVLTNGNKGTEDREIVPDDLVELRRQEQRDAARILGVTDVFFHDYEDGELMVTMEVKRDIARIIRQVRPDTVFTMDPGMLYSASTGFINHPDHRAAGQATLDAVFPLARDHLSLPELYLSEKLEPHKVSTVLLTRFSRDRDTDDFYVDISGVIDKKLSALAAHASQIPDMAGTQEFIRKRAAEAGEAAGCDYAEGFIRIDVR
jgi:LmbE family N-acetylglucosaminyl deacetylase